MNFTKSLLAVLVTAASASAASAAPFTINPLATFKHSENFDESAAEIVAFDPRSQRFFVVNADADTVDVLTLDDESLSLEADGDCSIDLAANNGFDGFTLGGPNSVAVSDGRLAVALEDADKQADGGVGVGVG